MKHSGKQTRSARSVDARAIACSASVTDSSGLAGAWTFGAGTVHHIALWAADDDALAEQKAIYEELGYTDASEIKDRFYFHSMYCRSPGGILIESCCNVPGGFEKDEPRNKLGRKLHVPPWFENRKAEIMAELEPITVPETAVTR